MKLTAAKKLKKYDRVVWQDGDIGPFRGTVISKSAKEVMFSWDEEDRDEIATLSSDDLYFFTFLERENDSTSEGS